MLLVSQIVLTINIVFLIIIVIIALCCYALVDEIDLHTYFSKRYRFWVFVIMLILTNYYFLFMDYIINSYLK